MIFTVFLSPGLQEVHTELESKLLQPNIENDLQLNEACLKSFAEEVGEMPENAVTIIKTNIC